MIDPIARLRTEDTIVYELLQGRQGDGQATVVGTAIGAFCAVANLDAKGFQRAFLVGGGPDHVVGIDTAGALAAPIFELPRVIVGLRRTDPAARRKLVDFLVGQREVMSYTP